MFLDFSYANFSFLKFEDPFFSLLFSSNVFDFFFSFPLKKLVTMLGRTSSHRAVHFDTSEQALKHFLPDPNNSITDASCVNKTTIRNTHVNPLYMIVEEWLYAKGNLLHNMGSYIFSGVKTSYSVCVISKISSLKKSSLSSSTNFIFSGGILQYFDVKMTSRES